jgi:hypothetical protein
VELDELSRRVIGLAEKSHAEKIKIFGWYLHTQKALAHFQVANVRKCYETLNFACPLSFSGYFKNLLSANEVLKNRSGYRLENRVREALDAQYGSREITMQVTDLLLSLPDKVPDLAERTYLDEALVCFKYGAFRAAIIMTWNLAYHHLGNHVLNHHLADFNQRWQVVFPGHHRKEKKRIDTMDDFNRELKESETIEVCNSANIITKDAYRILLEKLGRRNSAAHPSSVKIGQLQAEAFIDDLVNNVVLKLAQ